MKVTINLLIVTVILATLPAAAHAQFGGINIGGIDVGSVVGGSISRGATNGFQRHIEHSAADHVRRQLMNKGSRQVAEQLFRNVVVPQVAQIMSERRVEAYHVPYCHARPAHQPVAKPLTLDEQANLHFKKAQTALQSRDYARALKQLDQLDKIVKAHPDALQFRSVVYFAQGRYREASSMAYEALARGPGWNWTTLRTLFGSKEHYAEHYKALKTATKNNPESVDFHFLLGYHHLMLGHLEHGRREIQLAQQLLPNDELLANLLKSLPAKDQSVAAK